MKDVQLHEWTPKQFLIPTLNPEIAHQVPKKSKTTTKLSQNILSELTETKITDVALYEQTPKQFEPDPNPQNSLLEPKKVKKTPKISKNQISELKKTQKLKVAQLYEQTPKQSDQYASFDTHIAIVYDILCHMVYDINVIKPYFMT